MSIAKLSPRLSESDAIIRLSGKLVGTSMRSKDLAKASGLELRQPQGALVEGLWPGERGLQ